MKLQLKPSTVFMLAVLAAIAVWDVLAYFTMPPGSTISHTVYEWSLAHGWVRAAYYLGALLLGIHFFGLPWTRTKKR